MFVWHPIFSEPLPILIQFFEEPFLKYFLENVYSGLYVFIIIYP